jgi:uncharacterized membrane protein YgaE (UPF0421/DUF939 family)
MLRRRPERTAALAERAAPMIEDAAERSRVSVRMRFERLRLAWRSLLQVCLAAALAWLIATDVLGHKQPFFAPVAAIITLGITVGQRGRRAVELALGVAVGIAVADLLVLVIGTGAAQLALVVLLAMAAAIFLGSGQILATQAAVSAALVATLQPPTHGITFTRFTDALVGGGVALVVNALLLPGHPVDMVRRAAAPLLEELAATLEDVADAIEHRDADLARKTLERARHIDELEDVLAEAIEVGRETTRYALPRRRSRGLVESYGDAAARIDLAVRNVRVLARGTIRALSLDENVPPEVATALRDLAEATLALRAAIDDPSRADDVRDAAVRAASEATLVLESTGNMSVSVIVGQVRSTAVDLLTAVGFSFDEATGIVRAAVREAQDSVT